MRDRYLDVLRAAALVRVVALHAYGLVMLGVALPAMGVMFAVGGAVMAGSLERNGSLEVIGHRLRRVLPPLWVLAAAALPLMLLSGWAMRSGTPAYTHHGGEAPLRIYQVGYWLLPAGDPSGPASAEYLWGPLWYLRAYLWFVLVSPPLYWLARRFSVFAAAAPFAALFVLAVAGVRLPGLAGLVTGDMGLYGVCWVLGMARQTGQLARLRWPVAVGCAAVLAVMALWLRQYPGDPMRLGALVWLHWHPAASSEVNHVPLAEGPWSAAFALLALRWQPRLGAIDRHRWLAWAVRAVNARAMTIYLWHKPMIAVALLALAALSPGWPHAVLVGLMLGVLLAAITLAVGWVEDLAGRRPARLLPAVPLPSAPVLADAGDGGPGSGRPRPPAHTRAGG